MRPIIAFLALGLASSLCACSGGDKDSFRHVDHDNNEKISYEELLFVFPDVNPKVFAQLDTNGDGSLSQSEYAGFLASRAGQKTPATPAKTPTETAKPAATARPAAKPRPAAPARDEEVIEIPAPDTRAPAKNHGEKARQAAPKAENGARDDVTQYKVLRGDNLSRIAHKYGVSVEAIVQANGNMNPDTLRDGQMLNIPARP